MNSAPSATDVGRRPDSVLHRSRTVSAISVAPVKSLGLSHPTEVELLPNSVAGDHEFFLVDEEGRLFVSRRFPSLVKIGAEVAGTRLALHFPNGAVVDGEISLGEETFTDFYGFRTVEGNEVIGPWSGALSRYAGCRVRLLRARRGDGFDLAPVTIVASASVARLGRESGCAVDHRRFRMLFVVDGCEPHEEDTWRRVSLGEAIVRVGSKLGGPVPRCDVITHNPDTGERDLDALRLIRRYRGKAAEGIVFGVYADIERPGRVRLGDQVEPLP